MENLNHRFNRGDMVKCNYAPGENAVGEVIGYTESGEIEVFLSITRKRTKTVDKVKTVLKSSQVEPITLLYLDSDDEPEDDEDDEE